MDDVPLRSHKIYRLIYDDVLNHPYRDELSALHGSVIVRGGAILSVGLNHPGKCGFSESYKTHNGFTIHSELCAIKKVRKKIDLTGSVMYNLRISKNGEVRMSRPCPGCERLLLDYGIKKVYYSTDCGSISLLKMTELEVAA